ncbi:type II secretion system protein N [Caldimonas sp.]|uniref:type II secretion system protein N n=1 Tax=Caldimonas sp. TaxID=2838790 RepID=UPI00307E9A2D
MIAQLGAFVIWALAAASMVFWALRLGSAPLPVPPHAGTVMASSGSAVSVLRLLGGGPQPAGPAAPAPSAQSSRFKLVGVMAPAPGSPGPGAALIAVDGKTPRAYALGSVVDGDLVLLGLSHRSASLGPREGPATLTLELPALPAPQTGTLPVARPEGRTS